MTENDIRLRREEPGDRHGPPDEGAEIRKVVSLREALQRRRPAAVPAPEPPDDDDPGPRAA